MTNFSINIEGLPYNLVDVPGDGNCFFHSIVQSSVWKTCSYSHITSAEQLRNNIADMVLAQLVQQQSSPLSKALLELYDIVSKSDENQQSLEDFMNTAKNSTSIWGGDIFVIAISLLMNIKVEIVSLCARPDREGRRMIALNLQLFDITIDNVSKKYRLNLQDISATPIKILHHYYGFPSIICHRPSKHLVSHLDPMHQSIKANHFLLLEPSTTIQSLDNASALVYSFNHGVSDIEFVPENHLLPSMKRKAQTLLPSFPSKVENTKQSTLKKKKPTLSVTKKEPMKEPKKRKKATSPNKKHSQQYWRNLCEKFIQCGYKKQSDFLRSEYSGSEMSDSDKCRSQFSQKLRQYKSGKLVDRDDVFRVRSVKFGDIEKKVVQYLELREVSFVKTKCGLSWDLLLAKASQWAEKLEITNFSASRGWLQNVLHRNGFTMVIAHGEANEMDENEFQDQIAKWKQEVLKRSISKYGITRDRVYNADQTGLFYNKLPNKVFVSMENAKDFRGCKAMRSKDRVTIMLCTAADGSKVPLSIVGKSKNPHCFRLGSPPIKYTQQNKSWFTSKVMVWWVKEVFWQYHLSKHGNVYALLILDNCTAHNSLDADEFKRKHNIPKKLIIVFLPKNVTSRSQPADMGMVATLKVGYRYLMLNKLLSVYDANTFENLDKARSRQKRGCKGLAFGGKAHMLDVAEILDEIWRRDGKYASTKMIVNCWRKADILEDSFFETESVVEEETHLEEELQSLVKRLKNIALQKHKSDYIIKSDDAFADAGGTLVEVKDEEINNIVNNWCNIEDCEDVVNQEIDEAMEELQKEETNKNIDYDWDEEEMPDNKSDESEEEKGEFEVCTKDEAFDKMNEISEFFKSQSSDFTKEMNTLEILERNTRMKFIAEKVNTSTSDPTLHRYFDQKK